MKITLKKNLAFNNQPKPLLAKDVAKKTKTTKAKKELKEATVELGLILPTEGSARIDTVLFEQQGTKRTADSRVVLKVNNFKIGQHVFAPGTQAKAIATLGNKSRTLSKPLQSVGFLPEHLGLQTTPSALSREFQLKAADTRKYGNEATTIFPPDNRRVFNDTRYPWSTCGRVDSPLGSGSGVMIGPRHLLTCAHIVQWNNNNTTGWIRFRPSFFNGSAPFGEAWGVLTYYKNKVTGPTIDWIEGMYDYVVVVLNNRIGNLTGYMGARGYTDSWDGGAYWSHVGYPGDITGGNRPTFQNGIALDGAWWQFDSHEAMSHRGDVWPGQSGGPFFGWWNGENFPRVVAVQSSHNSSENNASGGQDMVDLVIRARNEHP
jgi:V8-like Glu-specific endopeptidase